jgi:hypothetical protein
MPMPSPGPDRDSETWVASHRELANLTIRSFLETGNWPDFDQLQRHLDRKGVVEDVEHAARSLPTLLPWTAHDRIFRVPLHVARYVADADLVVAACLHIVLRVSELYLSDDQEPELRRSDPGLNRFVPEELILDRALSLLWNSPPQPLSSRASGGDAGWHCMINPGVARRLHGVHDIGDYLQLQRQIVDEASGQRAVNTATSASSPNFRPNFDGDDVSSGQIFVSHASADKELADKVRDMLVLAGVPQERLFYSSDRATGIPSGQDVGTYLRETLRGASLVIELVSPTFLTRPMCLMELGGAWVMGLSTYPIVVPPLSRAEAVKAIGNVQMGILGTALEIDDVFDELHDRLKEDAGLNFRLPQWKRAIDSHKVQIAALMNAAVLSEDQSAEVGESLTRFPTSTSRDASPIGFSNESITNGRRGRELHVEVTNNDGVEHSGILAATFYDAIGAILGTEKVPLNQLGPGETKTVSFRNVPDHARRKLQSDTLF